MRSWERWWSSSGTPNFLFLRLVATKAKESSQSGEKLGEEMNLCFFSPQGHFCKSERNITGQDTRLKKNLRMEKKTKT